MHVQEKKRLACPVQIMMAAKSASISFSKERRVRSSKVKFGNTISQGIYFEPQEYLFLT
jgi:hypothetical protein